MKTSQWVWLLHFIPILAFAIFLGPVAGYRHLWQDEIETAERARAIVESGIPRVIDSSGRPSVNAAGREIEEATVHRYTPWVQFYVGAAGLQLRPILNSSADGALRLPFILLHGATSSLLSVGLTVAGMHPIGSVILSTAFGFQSVRMIHNRTARYHAILDFLFMLGLMTIPWLKRSNRVFKLTFAAVVFLLPHTHTIAGSLLSSVLVLIAILVPVLETGFTWRNLVASVRQNLSYSIIPAIASLLLLITLTRPWAQSAWAPADGARNFRSLKSGFEISYAFYFYFLSIIYVAWKRQFRLALILTGLFLYIVGAVRLMDFHPFSQTRYYLSLPIFFLFWFLALNPQRKLTLSTFAFLFVAILTPEAQGVIPWFRGITVVSNDYRLRSEDSIQPLQEAIEIIQAKSTKSEPVLFDYVPQFANWYLPEHPIALMPDRSTITALNEKNPIWKVKVDMPVWHLRTSTYNGVWNCSPNCDYSSTPVKDGRYIVSSKALGTSAEMCVIKIWRTERCNNAPFSQYEPEANRPEGNGTETLILARKCIK